MALIRYNDKHNGVKVYEPATSWDELVERMFSFPRFGFPTDSAITPALDISEDEKGMTLTVDLPGVEKEAVELHVEDNVLAISGEKKGEKEEEGKGYTRKETWSGSFRRHVALPSWANAGGIEADLKNGVLTVKVPRKPETEPRKIEVKVS
jgi:HSP20 family protein